MNLNKIKFKKTKMPSVLEEDKDLRGEAVLADRMKGGSYSYSAGLGGWRQLGRGSSVGSVVTDTGLAGLTCLTAHKRGLRWRVRLSEHDRPSLVVITLTAAPTY